MVIKNSKPFIIVGAALSAAIIALAAQVVFLSFTVQETKDVLRNMSGHTDITAVQMKVNGLQNNVLNLSRDIEALRGTLSRVDSEVNAMRSIVNKVGTDSQFLQQELSNFNARIEALEKHAANTEYTLKNFERTLRYQ